MQIAELFIKLGLTGEKETGEKLKNTKKDLGGIASMSLEAKAALIGVAYAVEQITAASARQGADFAKYAAYTGQNVEAMERWVSVMRRVNVGADAVKSGLTGIQGVVAKIDMGGAAPQHMGWLTDIVGFDTKQLHDASYVMEKLQEYAKKAKDPGTRNMVLAEWGISPELISGFIRNKRDVNKETPDYTAGQVESLARVSAQWDMLYAKIQRGFGKLTVKHGGEMMQNLDDIATKLLKIADALTAISEKLKVFKAISSVFELVSKSLGATNDLVDLASGKKTEAKDLRDFGAKYGGATTNGAATWAKFLTPQKAGQGEDEFIQQQLKKLAPSVRPQAPSQQPAAPVKQGDINIDISGVEDPQKAADLLKPHLDYAARQMFSQVQIT